MSFPTKADLIDFIYDEVRLLDDGKFSDWLNLWEPDGVYWMPLDYAQTDEKLVTSLLHEDMFMLRLRVERLNGERTFSQKPKSRCHHLIQRPNVDLLDIENGRFKTVTAMHYVETRLDEQFLLAVTAEHDLVLRDGAIKIKRKKVVLLNSDAAFRNIQLLP